MFHAHAASGEFTVPNNYVARVAKKAPLLARPRYAETPSERKKKAKQATKAPTADWYVNAKKRMEAEDTWYDER